MTPKPTPRETIQKAIEEIKNLSKEHRQEEDPDGFLVCPIEYEKNIKVAPKGEWLGTEQERKKSIKHHKKMLMMISCDTCEAYQKSLTHLKSIQQALDGAVGEIETNDFFADEKHNIIRNKFEGLQR